MPQDPIQFEPGFYGERVLAADIPVLQEFGLSGAGVTRLHGEYTTTRVHPRTDLLHVLVCHKGVGEVKVDDEWVAFTPGHVYVVRDVSFAFRTHARDSCEFAWARFILSWGRVDVPELPGTSLVRGDAGELWSACRLLYREASGQRREGVLRHAAALVSCMAVSAILGEVIDDRNRSLWDEVTADLQRKWTLDELARLAGKNRETLRRVTLEQHEMSPAKYVSHLRIVRAKQLLEESDLAIAQIADMLGYSTPAIFSKLFKQAAGLSPNRWRDQR